MARILLVDDERQILQMLSKILETSGHEPFAEQRGDTAIERLQEESFDLTITDLRMSPVNGLEVLRAARKLRPDMPVIILSAYGSEQTTKEAEQLGAYAFLAKPPTLSELRKTVEQALGEKQDGEDVAALENETETP